MNHNPDLSAAQTADETGNTNQILTADQAAEWYNHTPPADRYDGPGIKPMLIRSPTEPEWVCGPGDGVQFEWVGDLFHKPPTETHSIPLPPMPRPRFPAGATQLDKAIILDNAIQDAVTRSELVRTLTVERKHAGVTRQQVANHIGCTKKQIRKFESGATDPTLTFFQQYARAIGKHLQVEP